MYEQRGLNRAIALAALAGALAWSLAALAVEADTETAAGTSEQPFYHTVDSGETLSAIADRYGTSVASLIRENEIEDPRKVWAGARLRIPATARRIPNPGAEAKIDAETTVAVKTPGSTEIGSVLDRCEAEVRAARFEQALESAAEARRWLDAHGGAGDGQSRVRLEIASAIAHVALGQTDAALESLERALVADPDLELDPALTSPKVLAVFRAARGRVSPPQ